MENKTENLDSLKQEKATLEEEIKLLDSENDKEKISEITEKVNSLNDEIKVLDDEDEEDDIDSVKEANKRLYARAKKAEGFVLKDNKWVKEPKVVKKTETKTFNQPKDSDIDKLLDAKLEKRELESLDLSDDLKKEVETYAKVQGISIKKALNSDYISFLKEKEEKKERNDNASLGSKRKGTKKDYSTMKASDFDLKTPEGKADFAKYEEHLRTELG